MKNSWSLWIQGNTIRILLLMTFIIDIHPLHSNPLCYQMYQDHHLESNLSALSPIPSNTSKPFGITRELHFNLTASFLERFSLGIVNEVSGKSEDFEPVKSAIQKLVNIGFLLSPIHEALFLKSIELSAHKSETQMRNQLNPNNIEAIKTQKTDLNIVSTSAYVFSEIDKLSRHQIARKMFDILFKLGSPLNINRWGNLSSGTRIELASKFINDTGLKMNLYDLIEIVNGLSDLTFKIKEGLILEVLYLTLPEIYFASRTRTNILTID
ncbi:MAG: hypothetical protein J0M15_10755 [Deltaproteobacteria bacterium]|nr:hypothetical protein [Deltaproteobacteria bacterium]